VPEVRSPTLRRRELGALLRARRLELGLTVEQVAERLLCSPSKVSRMETGQRGATARDLRDLYEIYEITDAAQRTYLASLAAEGKQQGWWQSYDLGQFASYVGLEGAATAIKQFQSALIPGLLQTASYARATAETLVPEASPSLPQLSPERVDEFVEVKARRHDVLTKESAPQFSVVLDEAVLHRPVGGASGMKAQLDHVIEVSKFRNVTVQVIPYDVGAHPGMDSAFTILEFAPPVPRVVYVEGLIGHLYVERDQDIARYERVFEHLSTIALNPQESIELIAKVGASYRRGTTRAVRAQRVADTAGHDLIPSPAP
jgi:transcriptional regulator with XRE-family HTH domain